MTFTPSIEELVHTCACLTSLNPTAPYSFAAAIETGEIMECVTLTDLLDLLNRTQFSSTQCVLFHAESGEWVADGYYRTLKED